MPAAPRRDVSLINVKSNPTPTSDRLRVKDHSLIMPGLKFLVICIFLVLTTLCCEGSKSNDKEEIVWLKTVFVVMSQPDRYHSKKAEECRNRLQKSLKTREITTTPILVVGEDTPNHGAWTVFPIISHLGKKFNAAKWFIFLDEDSVVNLEALENVLQDRANDHFFGYALADQDHTIIHHFDEPNKLKYPHFGAGFILSGTVVSEVSTSMAENTRLDWLPNDFSIDAQYELAKALVDRRENHVLSHEPLFCLHYKQDNSCAIYPKSPSSCGETDQSVIDMSKKVLFAVKTCKKYHDERLPVIKKTWAEAAPKIMYFSEVTDHNLGTVQLDGVENTEKGHCGKTMSIIKYFHEKNAQDKDWEWLVIADDDTILSVAKIISMLHCFDPNEEDVHLGQRYGYRVAYGRHGYDYVTGGGGMVFSRKMVATMLLRGSK